MKVALRTIPIKMPPYEGHGLKQNRPFLKIANPRHPPAPPIVKDVRRRESPRVKCEARQNWFYDVLRLIAVTIKDHDIPWIFRTLDDQCWQLDRGAVGHAMAAKMIVQPRNSDKQLNAIRVTKRLLDGSSAWTDATQEIERQKRIARLATRPGQREFSEMLRRNYWNRCAVTGCATPVALQAAHIRVKKGRDNNSPENGILLRSDIHALFDAYLITLSEDGKTLEVSSQLVDPGYAFLHTVEVSSPVHGPRPSPQNIHHHRQEFFIRHETRPNKTR